MNETNLQYHLVFVAKYRKKLLFDKLLKLVQDVITFVSERHHFQVIEMGSEDGDHIHLVVSLRPTQSIRLIVQLLKQSTRYYIWQYYPVEMRTFYWYSNYLWSSGYFCSSLGNVSKEVVLEYVKKQSVSSTDVKNR